MNHPYRLDFPLLKHRDSDSRAALAYLDSAATSQKPQAVIDAIDYYYQNNNANPHRGAYSLSIEATRIYEETRDKVKTWIHAEHEEEIIFTKNATEAFNLIASSYGMQAVGEGDEIVLTIMEHHSNLIPWQRVCAAKGATLKYLYVDENGKISRQEYENKITARTKIVAITQISNVLGTINPIREIIAHTHQMGGVVVVDGTQAVLHLSVDVVDLDSDFYVFSGHKMLAPMGIGVLYGKRKLLEDMPPYMTGGDMVEYVYEQEATFAPLPQKFEGGTQNVGAAAGLGAAIDYINSIGHGEIERIEHELVEYALQQLRRLQYVTVYGPIEAEGRSGVISFNIDGVHPHDAASILDSFGVAIRAGNHCAQPLLRFMGLSATCRASFCFYNTTEEIDRLIEGIEKARECFGYGA